MAGAREGGCCERVNALVIEFDALRFGALKWSGVSEAPQGLEQQESSESAGIARNSCRF